LIVGESAINDAVALILFSTFADLLKSTFDDAKSVELKVAEFFLKLASEAIGSPLLGIVFSFGTALIFKHVDLRQHPSLELPLYMLLMYTPFVVAECFHLSGIVAIFCCGISARRYIAPNVSNATEKNADVLFKLTSYMAETCMFLELGLSVFGLPGSFNWAFIGWAFVATLFGRAVGIYPISFLYNYSLEETMKPETVTIQVKVPAECGWMRLESFGSNISDSTTHRKTPEKRKDKQISLAMTHVLWFAGLRGAVAYACVRKFPNSFGHTDEFTAAVMVIVLVSIIVMGGATESLLQMLHIAMNVDEEEYMKEWCKKRQLKGRFHQFGMLSWTLCAFLQYERFD
jgi:solute carrier family 9 (sodium/hydrogen exchanger), member 6/7